VSIIRFKRGTTGPTGLTLGEPAWDYANNRFFIGVTSEAIWVGAQIDGSTGLGTSQLKIPTQNAVKQYVDARSGVVSVNGQTGAVTISVSGGGVSSFNGLTGAVQGVSSVNGATGAITNVARINEGNTFSVRQVMNAGATMTTLYVSNGITFNGTRFELKNNSSPTIIGTNTSTNNLILRGNNSSAVTPADAIINLRGGDLDTPTYGEIDLFASVGRVNINTATFGVTANQLLEGTLIVTRLGTFYEGITASGATLNGNVAISGTLRTTGLGTFTGGITTNGFTASTVNAVSSVVTPAVSTPVVNASNLALTSVNETEVVPGVLYTGGEINVTAKNKIAFTVGSGSNTVPYPVLSFTNSNTNAAADITFTTLGGDIEMSAAGGIVFNPVTYVNMADGVLYVDDTNNRVGVNTTSPSVPLDVVGAMNVSGLGSFAAGISGTNGITFNNATVYIFNSGAVDPLFVQHSTSGSVKIATTGQARQGAIRFGNSATSTNNNFMQSVDGTLTFYQGFSNTGSNMLNFNATTLNVSPTITGATFSGLIRSTAGICANAGVTVGAHVSSESGYRITSGAIRTLTGTTYTFLTTDDGKIITSSNSSNQIFTVPTGLPVGFNCTVIQLGNAPVGFLGASGVTLNSFAGKTFTAGPHAAVSIIEYATNIVNISGGLTT
jgi:hypothetical protein